MDILVREFDEPDRNTLRRLYLDSRNAAFSWSEAGAHQAMDFDAHTEGEFILVAVGKGRLLGFASIWQPDSFVHNLFVHPSFMRQGVGRALLARCAHYCAKTPTLKCMKENADAMRFYTSQGWTALREDIGPEGPYFLMQSPHT